ncbi:MAG TPA: FG-GAP-like repeat-containing protein [Pyrinomonadaceae bacterium]|jgi:hypothetical protein
MKQTATNKHFKRVFAIVLFAAFWVSIPFILSDAPVSADELSDTRIQATLTGVAINAVTPAGFSEWRLDDGGRRRLDVQASSVNLPAGTVLSIVVNNAAIGQTSVNNLGGAFFSIDSNNGQTVPVINFGDPVEVRNGAGVVLSGRFGTVTATPSPSGSPNASPSPTASPSGSPSPSPSASPSAAPSGTPTGSPNPSPSPAGSDLVAGLSGGTVNGVLPSGFAQYELHSSRTELEVRVNQVNLPIGTPLAVSVNGAAVGQIILESGGQGRLRLRSDRGQNVPVVTAGAALTVQNAGAIVLSGIFAAATASPSPSGSPNASPSPTASPSGSPNPSPSATPNLGRYFEVHPTGARLDPPVSTAATGEFKVFLNADETQATLSGEFHNLSSPQTGARIQTTIGAGTLVHDFGAIGGKNGNFPNATINVSAVQVQQLRAGLWFATVSSVNHPNGEIGGALIQHSNGGDFDGDGSSDFAVFRPSTGTWYAQNSAGFRAFNFGGAADTPVSADYDGDGKTDAAVFKNVGGNALWEINRSSDGGITNAWFGYASDTPVRGDFDGDGRNDVAVYRASTGVWYVQNSDNTGYQIVQFGIGEDIPLSSDMDGDGKSDITVFRPSTGVWYWINSASGSVGIVRFGMAGDKPVKGDFDGDGRDDVAVYRPSTGVWYIWRSSDYGYDIRLWGIAEDIPVVGDYDGDNKTDIAVFRPSDGIWYIWRSVDNTYAYRHFGLSEDIPTTR